MQKKVSIITPCYNGQDFLERYLNSILNQTYNNIELIFIDDGSKDNTKKIFKKFEKEFHKRKIETIYIYQENSGQAVAINQGLRIFTGDYLTWPDSDDELTIDSIEKRVDFLEKNKNYGYVIANSELIDEKTKKLIRVTKNKSEDIEKKSLDEFIFSKKGWIPYGGYLVRREVIEKVIPNLKIFETRYGQNWQIVLPVVYYSKGRYIDNIAYKYYIRKNSHSRQKGSLEDELKKHNAHIEILKEVLTPLNEYKKREHEILDTYYTKMLKSSVEYKSNENIKKYYLKVKKIRKTTITEKRWYIESNNKMIRIIMMIPKKIMRVIRNVRYKE